MEAERDRHRAIARGPDGRRDRERRSAQLRLERQPRAGTENAAVNPSSAPNSKRAASTPPSPTLSWRSTRHPVAPASSPCIGNPLPSTRSGGDTDSRATSRPATENRVRPSRFAHGYSSGIPKTIRSATYAPAAPLAQQLLTAMAERASDHPGARDEGRLDATCRARGERQRGEPVHGPFAGHRTLSRRFLVPWRDPRQRHPLARVRVRKRDVRRRWSAEPGRGLGVADEDPGRSEPSGSSTHTLLTLFEAVHNPDPPWGLLLTLAQWSLIEEGARPTAQPSESRPRGRRRA